MAQCAEEAPAFTPTPVPEVGTAPGGDGFPAIVSLIGLRSMPSRLGKNLLVLLLVVASLGGAMATPHWSSSLHARQRKKSLGIE